MSSLVGALAESKIERKGREEESTQRLSKSVSYAALLNTFGNLLGDFWDTKKEMRLGSCLRRSLGMLRVFGRTEKY